MGHCCGTLLWDTLVGNSCGILLQDTLVGHSCRILLWDTPVGHTLRTRLPPKVTLRGCKLFVRDFLQKSRVKSQKRAFRTRLPPKVTCQVPNTSVLYETSSKTHRSKSAKRTFRMRLPPKVHHRSTHITQPCQAVSRFQPLQATPAHTPIPM